MLTGNDQETSGLRVEADVDQGVTSRLLDLLVAQRCFPRTFRLHRERDTMSLSAEFDPAAPAGTGLLARVRQIPGVRHAALLGGVH